MRPLSTARFVTLAALIAFGVPSLRASAQTTAPAQPADPGLAARRSARMEHALALGRARVAAGHPSLALAHFEDALRADPGSPEPYFELGRTLIVLARPADAISILAAGRRGAPDHLRLTLTLVDALVTNGQPREALATLRAAARRVSDGWELAQRRADIAREVGAWSEAADSYASLLDMGRTDGQVPEATLDHARQMLRALAIVLDEGHPRASSCAADETPTSSPETRWRRALAACGPSL